MVTLRRHLDPTPKGEPSLVPCPRPYDLRHSYAAWMLAAGVPAYDVARYMGTSVRMLDLTDGHLVQGSEDVARRRLDGFASAARERSGQEFATT
jgi:integrase